MQIQPSSGIAVAKRAFPVSLKAPCRGGIIVAGRGRKSSASQTQVPPMAGYAPGLGAGRQRSAARASASLCGRQGRRGHHKLADDCL